MPRKIHKTLAKLFDQKQQNLFCDVTLVATTDGTGIRAHRNVLHTASEYFEALLTADMKERSLDEIPLDGVSGAVLRQLVDYAYTQRIEIDASNVEDILVAADRFLLDKVVKKCEKFCLNSINAANALRMLAIAQNYQLKVLRFAARICVCDHFAEIVDGEAFVGLDAGILAIILDSDDILVESEEDVFNAIARWVEFDPDERKQHYASLMKTVRMSKIGSDFLHGRIQEWSLKMNLTYVYMEACAENHRQSVELTDVERETKFDHLFVVGNPQDFGDLRIERYSNATNSWDAALQIAEMNTTHIHCIEQCLYLFEESARQRVMRIQLSTMELEDREPMNNNRVNFASIAVGQYVYCIGGRNAGSVRRVNRYDTTNDEWLDLGMLNHRRFAAAAAVLAGKIYVVGGDDGVYLRSVERYDPETNAWTDVAKLNVARGRHRCCTIKGSIYAVGGHGQSGLLASIEKYDEQLDRWTIIRHGLDEPRRNFGLTAFGDWIYIAGGRTNDKPYSCDVRRINVRDGRIEKLASMTHKFHSVFAAMTSR